MFIIYIHMEFWRSAIRRRIENPQSNNLYSVQIVCDRIFGLLLNLLVLISTHGKHFLYSFDYSPSPYMYLAHISLSNKYMLTL